MKFFAVIISLSVLCVICYSAHSTNETTLTAVTEKGYYLVNNL